MLTTLSTEATNPRTRELDVLSTAELVAAMNHEDAAVAPAVSAVLDQIAEAVDLVVTARRNGGRLIYLGAGTSGRLGVLDAVECPPTFGTDPAEVLGLIAGGESALLSAVEGAEDDVIAAVRDLDDAGIGDRDVVVGLAASGRTPYVIAALQHAASVGARTVSVACNTGALVSAHADVAIEVDTGPEVLTGSTRLKAGTAQKMVCNMISTAAMVRTGKAYRNLMVDLRPTNAKLIERARRIVAEATGSDLTTAQEALAAADGHAKTAVVMLLAGCTRDEAASRLDAAAGHVRPAIAP